MSKENEGTVSPKKGQVDPWGGISIAADTASELVTGVRLFHGDVETKNKGVAKPTEGQK